MKIPPKEMVVRIAGEHDLHIFGFGAMDIFQNVHQCVINYIERTMPEWAEIKFY